ncbi:MAG: TPM domain-containing protein [Bifidobacterium sp.]|jgi:hypothetical protein|nr:TPM domain-containing protein [Bifidobacterium sp.]
MRARTIRRVKTDGVVEGLGFFHSFGVSRRIQNRDGTERSGAQQRGIVRAGATPVRGSVPVAAGLSAAAIKAFAAAAVVIAVFAALLCALPPAAAFADEGADSQTPPVSSGLTVTNDITDTENLLGDNTGAISDAIAKTRQETGVNVRLLYVSTFGNISNPERWAEDVLRSTKPAPNTVLLAVASSDGHLVVVVSSGSDEWLRSEKTAKDLSAAAVEPLTSGDSPDWSGSAMAMMNRIVTLKQTSTSSGVSKLGIALMGGALVALIVVIAAVLAWRRGHRVRHHSRRHAGKRTDRQPSDSRRRRGRGNGKGHGAMHSDAVHSGTRKASIEGIGQGDTDAEPEDEVKNAALAGEAVTDAAAGADMALGESARTDARVQDANPSNDSDNLGTQDTAGVQEIFSTASEASDHE